MDVLTVILFIFTAASVLGAAASIFYTVRANTIIATLKESNSAYKERNEQLETTNTNLTRDYSSKITELQGRVTALEKIKTPPFEPMMKLIATNHEEVMKE